MDNEKELKIINIIINILKEQLYKKNYEFFDLINAIALMNQEKDCLESNIKKLKGEVE